MSDHSALTAQLRRYRTVDLVEREHQMRMLDWLPTADRPFDRNSFTPGHITGSGFVVAEDGRAALIFHKQYLWVQPGGHADKGETDAAAVAAREVGEELGITVDPESMELFDLDIHQIARADDAPPHRHFDLRFLCVVPNTELNAGGDAVDAKWFNRSELAATGLDVGMRRMADKAMSRGLLEP